MKKILSFAFLLILISGNSQTTLIPDPNFEQALIDLGLDSGNPDGIIQTSSIDTVTFLNVNSKNISDLTGIEDFAALEILSCGVNPLTSVILANNSSLKELYIPACQLTSLDLSQNPLIGYVYCSNNLLTTLDFSNNPLLYGLECQNNDLTFCNISQNNGLYYLDCGISNQLTFLDVSHCDTLKFLYCDNNLLECLNLKNGNNAFPMILEAYNNPNLSCIEVDDPSWASTNWTVAWGNIDSGANFSNFCANACTSSMDELSKTERTLLKVIDLFGNEINFDSFGLSIRIYDDGSTEKWFKID